jgi:hypothetical protein
LKTYGSELRYNEKIFLASIRIADSIHDVASNMLVAVFYLSSCHDKLRRIPVIASSSDEGFQCVLDDLDIGDLDNLADSPL